MKPIFKEHNGELINYLFQALLVTYLILLLAEQIWPASVSAYLKLNYLLIIVIIAGILDVFSEHEIKKEKARKIDYVFIAILGIVGFLIIKFKTADLGWLSWLVSIIAGILIILLSLLILDEDEDDKENSKEEAKKNSRFSRKQKYIFLTIIILVALIVLSISLVLFVSLSYLEALRIVFGSIYVLFVPGFILSFVFFPKTRAFEERKNEEEREKGAIDWIERIALSFALSIAVVPLAVFYLNLIGLKINLLNSALTILGIIVISAGILVYRIKRMKKE